eukprot:3827150-Pleurochrysis_carterae.AAC.1
MHHTLATFTEVAALSSGPIGTTTSCFDSVVLLGGVDSAVDPQKNETQDDGLGHDHDDPTPRYGLNL